MLSHLILGSDTDMMTDVTWQTSVMEWHTGAGRMEVYAALRVTMAHIALCGFVPTVLLDMRDRSICHPQMKDYVLVTDQGLPQHNNIAISRRRMLHETLHINSEERQHESDAAQHVELIPVSECCEIQHLDASL